MDLLNGINFVSNLGGFGLVAYAIVYLMRYELPEIRKTIEKLSDSCRSERKEAEERFLAERNADRVSRHEMMNKFQSIIYDIFNHNNNSDDKKGQPHA